MPSTPPLAAKGGCRADSAVSDGAKGKTWIDPTGDFFYQLMADADRIGGDAHSDLFLHGGVLYHCETLCWQGTFAFRITERRASAKERRAA